MNAPDPGTNDSALSPINVASVTAEARKLLARNDPIACRWWVEWAGKLPAEAAIPGLCALLEPPQGFLRRSRWRHSDWGQVRAEAVRLLEFFGDPATIPILTQALLHDPYPDVRHNAAHALRHFGSAAVPTLLDALRHTENWPLAGMQALLRTLGDLKDDRVGPSLAKTLFGDLPLTPSRWTQRYLSWTACFSALTSLITMLSTGYFGAPFEAIVIVGIFSFLLYFPLAYLFLALPVGLIQAGRERNELNQAAADALIALQDKQALRSMIVIAFGAGTASARTQALRVLRALLPLLGPEDADLLKNASHERHLLDALGTVDADMSMRIIRALEFVGTGQAAGPVERLLRRYHFSTGLPQDDSLELEAERILALLKARLQQEQAASLLLRPSHLPHNAPEEMLRPVLDSAQTPAEQLLRPTNDQG